VAAGTHVGPPDEALVGDARDVDVVRREEEEEAAVTVPLEEAHGARGDDVRDLRVPPPRRLPAGHVADAADPVDDRLVVSMARQDPEQLGVPPAGGLAADRAG